MKNIKTYFQYDDTNALEHVYEDEIKHHKFHQKKDPDE